MSTHATAAKQWSPQDLAQLHTENQFRLRGLEVTRLDTFIDAAFAFVLTLLVISFDEIPANYEELVHALKLIPSFLMSFAVLMIFWLSHRRWSRWFGFESRRTVFLSLAIIVMILVYVYPLRIIFEAMFGSLSNGYFPASFETSGVQEFRWVFVFYSSGSLIMACLFYLLYRAALSAKDSLGLNEAELQATSGTMRAWMTWALLSALSIILAVSLPGHLIPLAGYILFLYFPVAWALQKFANPAQKQQD